MQIKNILSGGDNFLNITWNEWGRVVPAFIVKLLFQMAFVAGSTILIALYVGKYSVEKLPYMFIVQSLFVILGTTLLSGTLRRVPTKYLIIIGSAIAAFLLLVTPHFPETPLVFFSLAVIAISIFLTQVGIWISLFLENLFSPLEGVRVLPVVESAEPIGGILAGFLIVGLIGKVHTENMLGVVGLVLLLVPPVIIAFITHLKTFPVLQVRKTKKHIHKNQSLVRSIKRLVYRNRFLAGLFLVIYLQYSGFHLLEYLYTKQMDEHVSIEEELKISNAHDAEIATGAFSPARPIDHSGDLMESLGAVQIGIHILLFIMQLLFVSRVLQKIGVMRTFAMTPMFPFLAYLGLLFRFNIFSVVLTKGVYEISNGMGRNAFVNSFYALPESIRDDAKEVMEGIAKPLGLITGTLSIILLQHSLAPEKIVTALTVVLIVLGFGGTILAQRLKSRYTVLTKKKFDTDESIYEKMNAIEVLSQKGHDYALDFLIEKLAEKDVSTEVRIKILEIMGRMADTNAIPAILDCFDDERAEIRLAAVKTLRNFTKLGEQFFNQAFSRYRVLQALRQIYCQSRDREIKIAAIKVFANLNDPDIIPFLIEILLTPDPELRAESISVCGLFHDAGTIKHLEPYLEDEHPMVKSATIVALWQFLPMRMKLTMKMGGMLESNDIQTLRFGIYCAGETRSEHEKTKLKKLLHHKNDMIRRHAAIALAKLEEYHVVDTILEFLFHEEKEIGNKTKALILELNHRYQSVIHKRSLREVAWRVTKIMKNSETSILENLPLMTLYELLHLFQLVNAERESWNIRMIIAEREKRVTVLDYAALEYSHDYCRTGEARAE